MPFVNSTTALNNPTQRPRSSGRPISDFEFRISDFHLNRRHTTLYAALFLLALNAIWFFTLTLPFIHLDDPVLITNNPYVRNGLSWSTFLWACTTSFGDYWHPLTWLSLALDASLYGNHPWGYHLTNALLHSLNALLVFAIFRAMTRNIPRSLFAAILFSLHPERVESVAWATERKDVLAACCGFLAILAYFRYVRAPSAGRYLLICFLFFLGFLAKPLVVPLPFLLLLLDIWPLRRFSRATLWPLIKEKLPLFVLSLDGAINSYMQFATKGAFHATLLTRVENAIMNYALYVRDFFWPAHLALFYRAPESFPAIQLLGAAFVLIAVTAGILLALRARASFAMPLLIGWLWFIIAMAPTSGLLQMAYSTRSDRFTYLPSLGFILALLWGVVPALGLARRTLPVFALAAAATAALALCTLNRLALWRDPLALYQHDLQYDEQNAYLHELVGFAAADRGLVKLANEHFYRAFQLDPEDLIYRPIPAESQPATATRPQPP